MKFYFKEFVGIPLLLFLLAIIQTNFSVLTIKDIRPDLVLIFIFLLAFFERDSKTLLSPSFIGAVTGGFFLDIFSSLVLGIRALLFFALVWIIKKTTNFLAKRNAIAFSLLFVLFLTAYSIVLQFLVFNEISFSPLYIKIPYNLGLALLCFLIFRFFSSKKND